MGAPITVAARATVPLKPPAGFMEIVLVPLLPGPIGRLDGDAARVKPEVAADGAGMSSMPARVLLQSQLYSPPEGVNANQLFQESPELLRTAQARPTFVCAQARIAGLVRAP